MNLLDRKIDFVILWVNGSDKNWLYKKNKYLAKYNNYYHGGSSSERYRDYDTLLFLFRSIDNYAKWVNKIYLVTDHQVPVWLKNNKKVKIIFHDQIIKKQYLPVFNSSVIEMNIYKIPQLSENFVYFNDDMILNKRLRPSDFFLKGKPRDFRIYTSITPTEDFDHILINNGILLNSFIAGTWPKSKRGIINWKNGFNQLRTVLVLPQLIKSGIPGYLEPHGPLSFNKSIFLKAEKIWKKELKKNNLHRFRELNDITIWLIRHLQLELGEFYPRNPLFNRFYTLDQSEKIIKDLRKNISCSICINDKNIDDYDEKIAKIKNELYLKFPNKSQFEK